MSERVMISEAPIARPGSLFIDGRWADPESGGRIAVINPATEEVYVEVAEATEPDIDRAVAAARAAFDLGPWPRLTHAERAEYLRYRPRSRRTGR